MLGNPDLVGLRDALCDADNEADFILNGLDDRVSSEWWWHVEDSGIGLRVANGLFHGTKHRKAQMRLASFAGGHTTYHFRAICESLLDMESACLSGEALTEDLGIFVDEEVLYRRVIIASGRGLRERPASGGRRERLCGTGDHRSRVRRGR